MKCPNCQSINEESQKFCRTCGARLGIACPDCGAAVLISDRFCAECGLELKQKESPPKSPEEIPCERKQVTALFVDLSGYTTLSERLDPEELKDIVGPLIGDMAQVVIKYEGSVEKFAGDQIMALFGYPRAHEDDPVRAVRASIEIHRVVGEISHKVQEAVGQPLAVHIGINSGLVVTGQADFQHLTQHIAGDTINVASRLCTLAKAGETLVGQTTFVQANGFFSFEPLEPVRVKGKTKPIQVYRFLAPQELPKKTHRVFSQRTELIGRREEMAVLAKAVDRLSEGSGSFIAICGEAGTGKSRLLEEFKASLDLSTVNWIEGHAYNYTQNFSYYPLINLINRELGVEESDTPEKVAQKLEARLHELVGPREDVTPYLGSLLSLNYPEATRVSPEFWKSRLHRAVQAILRAQAQKAPTVIVLEDLHWADATFLELLRSIHMQERAPAITLCTYRPPMKVFSREDLKLLGESYQEIRLHDLSLADTHRMVKSILKTEAIPEELRGYIQERVGGNPFYLEEMLNSLIESGTLLRRRGQWQLARDIVDSDIPPTIHAVISGRIDRLEGPARNLLQEASVMGRRVTYEILKRVSEHPEVLDQSLAELERLDLIRPPTQSEQDYYFKHALIQEVVYNSLLKKDRQSIHQRIGLAMEEVFQDRLSEIFETLSFHFKQSEVSQKAVDYLIKAGRKSLEKYAVQESHHYYQEAFEILGKITGKSVKEKKRLVDLLNEWAEVFHYRVDFKGFTALLLNHLELAESIKDKARLGTYYGWLGFALFGTGKTRDSHEYSSKALKLGKEIKNYPIIGLAYANLTWTCAELKLLDQGIQYGIEAEEIARAYTLEPITFFLSLGGLGMIYLFKGNSQKCFEIGNKLLEYGEIRSNLRSIVVGHIVTGYGHYTQGDFIQAIECCKKAIESLNDPLFSEWPKLFLCMNYLINGQIEEAEVLIAEILPYCQNLGIGYIVTAAQVLRGAVLVAHGQLSRGIKTLEKDLRIFAENGRFFSLYVMETALAEIYFRIAIRAQALNFTGILKNLGFIISKLPWSRRRAEVYLNKVIQVGREVGSQGFVQGQALLNLGRLHRLNGERTSARECFAEALQILERCTAGTYSQQAREALATVS
ncbi:MAG: AAA family ATPase [Deltaproteobacteria bacterium]|nr:AAA family ATPase [Deltaproteobacteria bacterium]